MKILPSVFLLMAGVISTPLLAEDKVCFYEHPEYRGGEWCYGIGNVSNIGSSRNDKISSIKLYGEAKVEIFEHGNYKGDRNVVMANVYDMDRLKDGITSFKVSRRSSDNFACVFEHPGFRGSSHCLEAGQQESDLGRVGMRNNASSLMVIGNAKVDAWEDRNYKKKHQVLTRSTSDLDARPSGWIEDNIDSMKVSSRSLSDKEAAVEINQTLAHHVPIRQAAVLATHNSFSSTAYFNSQLIPGPNHRRAMIEQLQLGVRFFELDARTGDDITRICHSADCSWSNARTTLRRMLGEVDSWLKGADDNDVVFFFIQDDFGGDNTGYQQLKKDVDWMGDIVYSEGSCQAIAQATSFKTIRDSGKRVFFYKSGGNSGCSTASNVTLGSGFERNIGIQSINLSGDYVSSSTFLRSNECVNHFCNDQIAAENVLTALEIGVNGIGMDMIEESDLDNSNGRLNKQLWAVGPEGAGYRPFDHGRVMKFNRNGSRYMSISWNSHRRYACRLSNGSWAVTQASGDIWSGQSVCNTEYAGSTFDVPLNPVEAKALRGVMGSTSDVHINFGVSSGKWQPGKWASLGAR